MIKPDEIASKLKSEIDSQSVNTLKGGMESVLATNEFKNSIPSNGIQREEKNTKKSINKKPLKKGISDKLIGVTKLKKPVGKLTMGLPIMGEEGETSEATSSGAAGSVEGLFSTTKKEMEEGQIKKVEATEGTGAGASSGSYETTSFLAKSQSKKDWRGKSKTQIPGGKFVQVKKKCQKFPYCNQGDIKALKIFENEKVKKAIQNISERHNISENVIKTIIAYEYENTFSK
jgi:hypothetical protein